MENNQPVIIQTPKAPETAPKVSGRAAKIAKIKQFHESSMKTFSIIGLIALLALVSFGVVKVAPTVIRGIAAAAVSLSSIFIPAEKLAVATDKSAVGSGEVFQLSWGFISTSTTADGSYTVSYPCIEGLHLEAVSRPSNDLIFCNTAFRFLNDGNKLTLVAVSNRPQPIDVPLTVSFTRNNEASVSTQASTKITVSAGTNPNTIQPPVAPANNTTNNNATNTTGNYRPNDVVLIPGSNGQASTNNLNGNVDLTARVLETGYINKDTGVFTPAKEVKADQRAAIRFEVINLGTKTSGDWTFAAVLPTFPSFIFQSGGQRPLASGDRVQFTLGFDSILRQAENSFTLNVDPLGSVQENDRANNIIKGKIYVNLN